MQTESRRSFARKTGLAAAGTFLNLNPLARGANETVTLALIGVRNQGRGVALRSIEKGARIKTVCDLDPQVLAQRIPELEKAQGRPPGTCTDFRAVLDDKDIDGVIVATPDHWHTHMSIAACQAGKDVYLEKPVSQTIHEGHLIRDAARKYHRIVQVGTQRRSGEHFRTAAEYAASGKLGKVCLVKAWMCQVRTSIGNPPDQDPPTGVNYDAWLGPAPKRAFNPNRFHYNWRFFWDYGNSELGNQGVHMLDVALMGIQALRGTEHCLPARVSGHGGIYWLKDAKEVPDTQVVTYDFGDVLLTWELRSFSKASPIEGTAAGTGFYGTDATLIVDGDGWRVLDRDNRVVTQAAASGGSHEGDFIDCVKSRRRPNADIEIGRLSTTLCHLGNISHHLGRQVVFDPRTESFGADRAATALLGKQYRREYPLPKV